MLALDQQREWLTLQRDDFQRVRGALRRRLCPLLEYFPVTCSIAYRNLNVIHY
jgi:hypothetical protein